MCGSRGLPSPALSAQFQEGWLAEQQVSHWISQANSHWCISRQILFQEVHECQCGLPGVGSRAQQSACGTAKAGQGRGRSVQHTAGIMMLYLCHYLQGTGNCECLAVWMSGDVGLSELSVTVTLGQSVATAAWRQV